MKTYENNMADQALIVKRLTVLESADGGAFREIRQTVDAVKKQTNVIDRQQQEYWKILSDDGIITPIEKQSLLRESRNIDRSFAAITQQAASLQVASALLEDYIATYNALHSYLFTTLKLFDDMTSETQIDDRESFNQYFSNYYFSENFVLLAITAGILDTIDFRVLQSLTEPGEEGETAIYRGGLYQYVNGEWKNVTTGAYKGPRTELPPDEEESFFIVSESFLMADVLIVNGEELLVNNDTLLISHTYQKGYIYYFQDGTWHPEWDKTNWRYAAAFADVINITGELPQIFQDAIDNLQTQIDAKASQTSLQDEIDARQGQETIINGQIITIDDRTMEIIARADEQAQDIAGLDSDLTNLSGTVSGISNTVDGLSTTVTQQGQAINTKIDHLPVYYGVSTPQNPKQGDFYLYLGHDQHEGWIRRYNNGSWEWLDPEVPTYGSYYMQAMSEIMQYEKDNPNVFPVLWAANFFALWANITNLTVKTIFLRHNGAIQSDGLLYVPETVGLKINTNGDIDANGNTHLGATSSNKVAIGVPLAGNTDFDTYDIVIGGNCKISGVLSALRFELIGVQAGNVVQREYEDIFNDANTYKLFNLCSLTRGTMRIKIFYNATRIGDMGPAIVIKDETINITTSGSGVITRDISFSEYQNINIGISDIGQALSDGGLISVSKIQVCLSEDDSIFKNFLQFFLKDTKIDRSR